MDEAKPDDEVLRQTEVMARLPMPHLPGAARKLTWDEVATGFSAEQAVAEAKRCLNCAVCSECMECVRACGPGALLHGEKDREFDVEVGAVVLATGFDLYDPGDKGEYGYGRYPNILSALEYERMLSASGPTIGEVKRPSNGEHPGKIAFIQCVGSRDQDHEYCSSVCCMFANKQAMLTHRPRARVLNPTSFSWTCAPRARASTPSTSARRTWASTSSARGPRTSKRTPQTKDLLITWEDETGALHTDRYDMVVLSVGLEPARKAQAAAGALGVALNRHGFCELHEYAPLDTSREGVYVVGPLRRAQGHSRLGRPGLGRGGQGHGRPRRLARHAHGRQGVPRRARRGRRGAPGRRVRLPLRLEHRRRDRRRGCRRVRPQAARRGLRQRHHVHVLVRLARRSSRTWSPSTT